MKPQNWAAIRPDSVCKDGPTWRAKFGTHVENGIEYCCSCGGFFDVDLEKAMKGIVSGGSDKSGSEAFPTA